MWRQTYAIGLVFQRIAQSILRKIRCYNINRAYGSTLHNLVPVVGVLTDHYFNNQNNKLARISNSVAYFTASILSDNSQLCTNPDLPF